MLTEVGSFHPWLQAVGKQGLRTLNSTQSAGCVGAVAFCSRPAPSGDICAAGVLCVEQRDSTEDCASGVTGAVGSRSLRVTA